jgi:hypothetical protein
MKDSFIPTLFRTIELQNKAISWQNEEYIDLFCKVNNIKINHYHLESLLTTFYDTNVESRRIDYENGLIIGKL